MIHSNKIVRCITAIAALPILSTAEAESPRISGNEQIDTVTVEAERVRLERQISTFVTEIARSSRAESLARWQVPICPLVAGLSLEQGTFVFQRLSRVVSEAGAPLAPTECQPNLIVVMTREPEQLLKTWWRDQPRLMNTDKGVARIKREIARDAPVRVFYNACSIPTGLSRTFAPSVLAYCNVGQLGSRLTWSTVRAIYTVIVVVDKGKTEDVAIGPLTDYVAMIALASIRKDPDLGSAPTILRLFEAGNAARPAGMSEWDRTFLASLYSTNTADVQQVSEIKRRMKKELVR